MRKNSPDSILINIIDNGIGIVEIEISQIFKPLNTASKQGTDGEKSFGLGLSICKQIVEFHEDSILVDSKEGMGSTFWIRLPI